MRRLLAMGLLLALAACSKEKEVNPPAELVDLKPTLRVDHVWDVTSGGAKAPLRFGLGVHAVGDRIYAGGHDGEVVAVDANNGRTLWRTKTKAPLAGGTGADESRVVVGSSKGDVIALDANDGRELWRVKVGGEVLSAPLVIPGAVIVRTVDGRLRSLSPEDGRTLWELEQQIPRLTLRGAAAPAAAGEFVVCGFDNGKVVGASLRDGAVVWETPVAPPRGRTELERLSDIDSAVRISGEDVFAVGFQGRAAMLALATGQVWWSRDVSSNRGLDIDDERVYVATSEGDVVALERRSGAEVWRQKGLAWRGLSAPVVAGQYIAVGDYEGYLHFLDKSNGEFVARVKTGGERISNPPIYAGGLVIVINDEGRVSAFRPQAPATAG